MEKIKEINNGNFLIKKCPNKYFFLQKNKLNS